MPEPSTETTQTTGTKFLGQLRGQPGWAATQVSLVHDEIYYKRIIHSFLAASHIPDNGNQLPEPFAPDSDLITVGRRYAQLTTRSLEAKATQKQLSSFQFLIWLSYLAFLLEQGYSKERVDGVLQLLTSNDERRRRRFIPRALKINSVIQTIARTCDIGIARATELFFLYAMTSHELLAISDEALESIPEILSLTGCDYKACMTSHYTIPTLLLSLITTAGLATSTSLDEICVALRYSKDAVLLCPLSDIYRVDSAICKIEPEPLTIIVDPVTHADSARGCEATIAAPAIRVVSTGTLKPRGISKRRKTKPKAPTWNVVYEIAPTKGIPALYENLEGTYSTDRKNGIESVWRGADSAGQSASQTHFPQRVTQDQSGEHKESASLFPGDAGADTAQDDSGNLGSPALLPVMPVGQLNPEVSNALNASSLPSGSRQIAETVSSQPGTRQYLSFWASIPVDGRLLLIAQWPVPHSTDVLRTYWWSTLDAVKVFNGQQHNPSYSDERYDYYHVALDEAKGLLPEPTLAEAIQQSSLYQEELRQWELSTLCSKFRTSSCIIGLGRGPDFLARCILQATVRRPVQNEKLQTTYALC